MNIKERLLCDLDLQDLLLCDDIAEVPAEMEGDCAIPCFKLAKIKRSAPAKIASDICAAAEIKGIVEKLIPVGPYINVVLNKKAVAKLVFDNVWENKDYGKTDEGKGKRICIDYSSITLSKHVHIGHLCTTVIGECLAKLFENAGYDVVRINYLGDMGTPFGKIIAMYKLMGDEEKLEKDGVDEIQRLYAKFATEVEKDESLQEKAREWSLKIENGDEEAAGLCARFKAIALGEAKSIYKLLGIDFDDWRGELFYNDRTGDVVDLLTEKGLIVDSDGAKCVDLKDFDMGMCLIQRSDGGSLYTTRDLAAAIDRANMYKFEKCLYVTGIEQKHHFASFFKVLSLAGFDWADRLEHVGYGRLSTEFGRISGREGSTPIMKDIFNASIDKARKTVEGRGLDDSIAVDIGVSAVAFSVLKTEKIKDSVFSLDQAISFDGNSSVYLQYSYVRLMNIINKNSDGDISCANIDLLTENEETDLLMHIDTFPSVLKNAMDERESFFVTRYALTLASLINKYYNSFRVVSEDKDLTMARMALCKICASVLERAMTIVGVKIVDKM